MRSFKLIILFWRQAIMREMAYPVHFWFLIGVQIIAFFVTIITVFVIFSQTPALAGWSRGEALALLAVYGIALALLKFFFEASFLGFCHDVHSGGFDFYLVRPFDPRLAMSFSALLFDQLGFLVPNIALLIFLVVKGMIVVTIATAVGFLFLFFLGLCIGYCLFFSLTLFVFWAPAIEHFSYLYGVLVSVVRFPLDIYGGAARRILLTILPLGFLVTIPTEFFIGRGTMQGVVIAIAVTIIVFIATQRWWRFALRHYSSASS